MDVRTADAKTALLRAIREHGGPMEAKTLAAEMSDLGHRPRDVHRAIQHALSRDELRLDSRLRFVVRDEALEAA